MNTFGAQTATFNMKHCMVGCPLTIVIYLFNVSFYNSNLWVVRKSSMI